MSRPFVNDTGITFEKAMECKTFKKSNFTFEAQLGRNEAYNIVSLTQNHSSQLENMTPKKILQKINDK